MELNFPCFTTNHKHFQIWVVTRHQYGIILRLFLRPSFRWETTGSVDKSRLYHRLGCCKVRWTVIKYCDNFFYYNLRHSLLQIATGITYTKCDDWYKLRHCTVVSVLLPVFGTRRLLLERAMMF